MDIRFLGTGGAAGWPAPDCRCASCLRAAADGPRRPTAVLVDGRLRISAGQPPALAAFDRLPSAPDRLRSASDRLPSGAVTAADAVTAASAAAGAGVAFGEGSGHGEYQVAPVAGGWDITGPSGARLLAAAGPGAVPDPPAGTGPFDILLLDLLGAPAQLGDLRLRGLARPDSVVAVLAADHRVGSAAELARRCGFWRAVAPVDGDVLSTVARWLPRPTASRPHRALILGGARSGKSREAELRLAAEPVVTYLAAGPYPDSRRASAGLAVGGRTPADRRASGARGGDWPGGGWTPDAEWAQRVAAHQAARPAWWSTVESTDVAGALRRLSGAVLIDGLGTWLTAVLTEAGAWGPATGPAAGPDAAGQVAARLDDLIAAWRQTSARVVAVSDQVGSGVVPATPAGRLFRDQLGWLNQRLAAESEQTSLVVAGRVLSWPT